MSIQLKDYVAAIYDKGGIGTEDILNEAITKEKLNSNLKSEAITDLDAAENDLATIVGKINSILAALRKAGIIATE